MLLEISKKLNHIDKYPNENVAFSVKPFGQYTKAKDFKHQFLIFLKPEILSLREGVNIEAVLEFIFDHYQKWGIHVEGVRVLSGAYLHQHNIISKNYETLHKISHNGLDACSERVKFRLDEVFVDYNIPKTNILGGHQFLKINPAFSPESLNKTINSLKTYKLGSGAYAVKLEYKDALYILLNAFHPFQVNSLTKLGNTIIALECFSNYPWTLLRHDFVGTVYPEQSKRGSLRRELFEQKEFFNIKTIDISNNGVHISPGPIEASFQLINFFVEESNSSDFFLHMTFFRKMNNNIRREIISILRNNPQVNKEGEPYKSSLFEWTEDMNSEEADKFLKEQYHHFVL